MEQWSILGNIVNYVQYDRYPKNFHNLNIKAVDQKWYKKRYNREEERQMLELDFGDMSEKLKGEYLDMYEGIQSGILSTTRFDETSDLSTTYLGRVDITRTSKIQMEEGFPISELGHTVGKLLDVKYYWMQELANQLCLNHIIYVLRHFIHCQNLHLKHREFK